jgi:ubiquinone/menaquinone biosynthesis C-methylase UbiE
MAATKQKKLITPEKISRISWAATETITLSTAVQFDLFTHIANGKSSAREIARATQASARAIERLLNALCGLELLTKENDRYHLQPDAETYLVRGRPGYIGKMIMSNLQLMEGWKNLPQCVKAGKPIMSVNTQEQGESFFITLVRALFPNNFRISSATAASLKKRGQKIETILDIAAGSAAWSLGFALHYPAARVTALDFPGVLQVTREFVAEQAAESRYDYLSGDLNTTAFGKNRYDLIILGHICHSEGEKRTRKLIKKCAQALRPGGLLLIAEMLPNDDRSDPLFPLLFALHMLIFTESGDVFTIAEFREWTAQAGLKNFQILDQVPAPSPLLLAEK